MKRPRPISGGDNPLRSLLVKGLDRVGQVWLWLTVILMPILAIAGGKGFQVAGLLIGLFGLLVCVMDRRLPQYLKSLWPVFLLAFLSWAWLSTLWSPKDSDFWGGHASILFGLVFTLLFIPVICLNLPETLKKALVWAVISVGLCGVLVMLIDSASNYALSLMGDPLRLGEDPIKRRGDAEMNLGRGQVSYALLLWPVAALIMLRIKRGWAVALAAFMGLSISAYLNNLSVILPAIILAGVFAGLAYQRPKLGIMLAFFFAITTIALAPLVGILSSLADVELMRKLPLSWEHRLRMWAYSWELIPKAPLFGHGFDASRAYEELTFRAPDGRDIVVMSMHPHNIGLHIWLETGLVGVLLSVGFLMSLMKIVLKMCETPLQAVFTTGLIVSTAACGTVTVGVWQHWWWALIAIAASLLCLSSQSRQNSTCVL
jgi:O-antigen ligase